jgi:hypothetical protein
LENLCAFYSRFKYNKMLTELTQYALANDDGGGVGAAAGLTLVRLITGGQRKRSINDVSNCRSTGAGGSIQLEQYSEDH